MTTNHQPARTYTAVSLFGGGGLFSHGLEQSRPGWRGIAGRFKVVASIDSWPVASRVHEYLCPGSRAVTMDLFTRTDYTAFHGHPPPADWIEATPADLRALCPDGPDVLITSPPCKGFSSNLSGKKAASPKYQSLGRLTLRGLWLALEAWSDCQPRLILFENVPRIRNRGAELLDEIRALLISRGYAVDDRDHDAGQLGGLAQTRKRFLLAARLKTGAPFPVHLPTLKPLRGIGEVISQVPCPLPGTKLPPMHEVPKGQHWLTALRLTLIPPGRDWRALQEVEAYAVAWHPGLGYWMVAALRDGESWRAPSGWREGQVVGTWEREKGGLVASWMADRGWAQLGYRLRGWEETAGTVGSHGGSATGSGSTFVADPRIQSDTRHAGSLGVQPWGAPGSTVTGASSTSSGPKAVADPRLPGERFSNACRVDGWGDPAPTVTSKDRVSIADPRLGCAPRAGAYGVMGWDETSPTVAASVDIHAGTTAVMDPRLGERHENEECGACDDSGTDADREELRSTCAGRVAQMPRRPGGDRRVGRHHGHGSQGGVAEETGQGKCVDHSGRSRIAPDYRTRGAWADPRLGGENDKDSGAAGSVRERTRGAPRVAEPGDLQGMSEPDHKTAGGPGRGRGDANPTPTLPAPRDRGAWVILGPWDAWHRPCTTLEVALLQGLPAKLRGAPLDFYALGLSDRDAREVIGNGVPPPAAREIGEEFGQALLEADGAVPVRMLLGGRWVQPEVS